MKPFSYLSYFEILRPSTLTSHLKLSMKNECWQQSACSCGQNWNLTKLWYQWSGHATIHSHHNVVSRWNLNSWAAHTSYMIYILWPPSSLKSAVLCQLSPALAELFHQSQKHDFYKCINHYLSISGFAPNFHAPGKIFPIKVQTRNCNCILLYYSRE